MTLQFRSAETNQLFARMGGDEYTNFPQLGTDRASLQNLFYALAVRAGAKFRFDCGIVDMVEDETVKVTLQDGKVEAVDLFIAADGIFSRLREKIVDKVDPILSPSIHYPAVISKEDLLNDEVTNPFITTSDASDSFMWNQKGSYAIAKYNPAKDNFNVMYCIQNLADEDGKLWDSHGDVGIIRQYFGSSNPILKALVEKTKHCSRWRLSQLPDLPRWRSPKGRMILLGDSAHAMLPNAAQVRKAHNLITSLLINDQGYSSIVEDIEALSIFLKSSHALPTLTEAWELLRMPRAYRLKDLADFNYKMFSGGREPTSASMSVNPDADWSTPPFEAQPDAEAPFHTPAFSKWLHDYDTTAEVGPAELWWEKF